MALSLKSLRSASVSSEAGEMKNERLCSAPCDCRAVESLGHDKHHGLCLETVSPQQLQEGASWTVKLFVDMS